MTNDEAEIIIKIMMTADNKCSVCVNRLLKQFIKKFPELNEFVRCVLKENPSKYDSSELKGLDDKYDEDE
jgi:hypothetical protein